MPNSLINKPIKYSYIVFNLGGTYNPIIETADQKCILRAHSFNNTTLLVNIRYTLYDPEIKVNNLTGYLVSIVSDCVYSSIEHQVSKSLVFRSLVFKICSVDLFFLLESLFT